MTIVYNMKKIVQFLLYNYTPIPRVVDAIIFKKIGSLFFKNYNPIPLPKIDDL